MKKALLFSALAFMAHETQAFDFTSAELNFARAYAHESVQAAYQGQSNLITLALNEGKRPFERVDLTTLLNTYDENELRGAHTYEKGYWALYEGRVYRVGQQFSPMEKAPQYYIDVNNPKGGEYHARLYFLNQEKALDELIALKRDQQITVLCQDEGLKERTVNFTCYSHGELLRKLTKELDESVERFKHNFVPHKDILTILLRNSVLYWPVLPGHVQKACQESEKACTESYLAFRATPEFATWVKKRPSLVPAEHKARVDQFFNQAR